MDEDLIAALDQERWDDALTLLGAAEQINVPLVAFCLAQSGRFDRARQIYRTLFDESAAKDQRAIWAHQLAMTERLAGDAGAATGWLDTERDLLPDQDAPQRWAAHHSERGDVARLATDPLAARVAFDTALQFADLADDAMATAIALRGIAMTAHGAGDADTAKQFGDAAVLVFREIGDEIGVRGVETALEAPVVGAH